MLWTEKLLRKFPFFANQSEKDCWNIVRHWLYNQMTCIQQLTVLSLHWVAIWQAMPGFQFIPLKKQKGF